MLIDVCYTQECDQKRPKFSFHWDESFIMKKCVSIDFFGPRGTTLYFEQYLSEYFAKPYILFPEVCHFRYYEEGKVKILCHCDESFFLIFCFQLLLRSSRNDS